VDASTARGGTLPVSKAGLVAGGLALGLDVLYLLIIQRQGAEGDAGRVVFVAAVIAVAGGCAVIGATRSTAGARLPWLAIATGALASLGYLGLFSIGLGLLVASVLTGIAWGSASRALEATGARRERAVALGCALAGAAVPWIGILLT
jgi:hypothetical protein